MHIRPVTHARALAWGLPEMAMWPTHAPHFVIAQSPGQGFEAHQSQSILDWASNHLSAHQCPRGLILAGSPSAFENAIGDLAALQTKSAPQILKALSPLFRCRFYGHQNPLPNAVVTHRGNIDLTSPKVMGIINATPDSFYPGSRVKTVEMAVDRAMKMIEAGADILDIGGESTRPGAEIVSAEEEILRVVPIIDELRDRTDTPISIDTSKASVAQAAVNAGAWLINDVWSFQADEKMASVAADTGAGVVLMHGRGNSRTMGQLAQYQCIVGEVIDELAVHLNTARRAGVQDDRIILDPGIGFAKLGAMNVELLTDLSALRCLGRPLLLGASRKSFLQQVFDQPMEKRLPGSLAAVAQGIRAGVKILRVHDVWETKMFSEVLFAFENT